MAELNLEELTNYEITDLSSYKSNAVSDLTRMQNIKIGHLVSVNITCMVTFSSSSASRQFNVIAQTFPNSPKSGETWNLAGWYETQASDSDVFVQRIYATSTQIHVVLNKAITTGILHISGVYFI